MIDYFVIGKITSEDVYAVGDTEDNRIDIDQGSWICAEITDSNNNDGGLLVWLLAKHRVNDCSADPDDDPYFFFKPIINTYDYTYLVRSTGAVKLNYLTILPKESHTLEDILWLMEDDIIQLEPSYEEERHYRKAKEEWLDRAFSRLDARKGEKSENVCKESEDSK